MFLWSDVRTALLIVGRHPMAANDMHFQPPLLRDTLLAARGFGVSGARAGGIINPSVVEIPAGSCLFRFYHDPSRDYGEWWATPYELSVIVEYFGRGAGAIGEGRQQGKGILHATFAVRHDWAQGTPLHLGTFLVARLNDPLKAYFGEGDHAPDATQKSVQKAIRIIDHTGNQRLGRQVFLPKAWTYKASFPRISGGTSDTDLLNTLRRTNTNRLPFET
jgi:hypothetical protein